METDGKRLKKKGVKRKQARVQQDESDRTVEEDTDQSAVTKTGKKRTNCGNFVHDISRDVCKSRINDCRDYRDFRLVP